MAKFIKYKICENVNTGTADAPNIKEVLYDVTLPCSDKNKEIAKKEAYNGEYEIFDDGQPESVPEPSIWDELDAAYQEGVNRAYDQ